MNRRLVLVLTALLSIVLGGCAKESSHAAAESTSTHRIDAGTLTYVAPPGFEPAPADSGSSSVASSSAGASTSTLVTLNGPDSAPPTVITVTTSTPTAGSLHDAVRAHRDAFEAAHDVDTDNGSPMLPNVDGEKLFAWTVANYQAGDIEQTIAQIETRHDGTDYAFTVTAPVADAYSVRESLRLLVESVRWV